MNFYKHHLGDYAQATAHLSFIEDAAYSRLIRKYYADEKPIPTDIKAAQRLVGARSKDEREAVETVLREFFVLEDDGWHNKRCDAELEKANAQAETNRRIAEEREARRRERTQHDQGTNRDTNRATNRQPSQTPDSRHQTPEESASALSPPAAPTAEACKAMRQAGLPDANPSSPKLKALLTAGMTLDELSAAAADAVEKGKGFAYALATAEGRRRDAATAPLPAHRTNAPAAEPQWRREQRERTQQAAPGVAVASPAQAADFFIDVEARNVTLPRLG